MKDLNVYVLSHKDVPFKYDYTDSYRFLEVGSALHNEPIYNIRDNSGENISKLNQIYTEITGHYWIWKNASKTKYIGVEHYRRHLDIDEVNIESIFEGYDIILPKKLYLRDTVSNFYGYCHNIEDLNLCKDIIYEFYPEYKESYEKYIENGNFMYIANSFITTSKNFDKICEFIFSIFFEFEKRMGFNSIDEWRRYIQESNVQICPEDHIKNGLSWVDYQMRIFGALSERLITLYVLHNFENKIYETDLIRVDKCNKNMKTLLCCIGRLENQYIREYVEYYKNLGITNICLFDNNHDNEEDFRDAIGDYIDNGFVILKDYKNRKVCQLDAYNECYTTYGNEYDWIAFFDIDEFMFIHDGKKINDYLSMKEFNNYDMIHINWLLFGDGDKLKNDNRPLLQRIIKPLDIDLRTLYDFPDNFHVKSIIRGGLKNIIWGQTPHTPINNIICCNASGEECISNSPFTPYDFRKAGLLHFTTKTAEEYAMKIKRGFPDGNTVTKEKQIEIFFKRNEITKEKINIFKEILNIDMSYLLPYEGEKNKDIQIYSLCYSKKNFKFLNDSVITPLQVGAANGTNVCVLKDNIGDNISDKNYFYIENTGTYWIWKNVKDAKYKGQMQYRRPLEGVNESMNFDEVFSKYKVITCKPFNHPANSQPTKENPMFIPAMTVEQGYAFSNCIDDLKIIEMVINIYYPEYKDSYDKFIKNGENLYYSNGFIMKSEDYNKYCEFLFDCLNKYQQFIDVSTPQMLRDRVVYNMEVGKYPKHMNPQSRSEEAIRWQMSIGGFLSERIWTLWLLHNFKEEEILKLPYNKMEENMYT